MRTSEDLIAALKALNGKPYGLYKQVKGRYSFGTFDLVIDHIQGDPFAAPSKMRIFLPQSEARFPPDTFEGGSREVALRDFLTRAFADNARFFSRPCGSGKSGLIGIDRPGQQVLNRTSMFVYNDYVEARFVAGMPADGRRILGFEAARMLGDDLPKIVNAALRYQNLPADEIYRAVRVAEDADYLRASLKSHNLVCFIANGSVLPRLSGIDDRPLSENSVPFQAPPELTVTLTCPNRGRISGLGIKRGITLIVGGGYHGKSTLLKAIERGVYNHIPGDGREYVITDPDAMKVRAEDGRAVTGVTISPFINNLPQSKSTFDFSTTNASGSTSQAANIVEAIEAGCSALLIDEDTSATNFMIRDKRMQELIVKNKEPITPFTDKVKQLLHDQGISTILVMGGSGDYFEHADCVIAMDQFQPFDVTAKAKAIADHYKTGRTPEGGSHFGDLKPRHPQAQSFNPRKGRRDIAWKVRKLNDLAFGEDEIDLSAVEQLVHESQLRAIALALILLKEKFLNDTPDMTTLLKRIEDFVEINGLSSLCATPDGDIAHFRRLELAATLNRLRSLQVHHAAK